MPKRRIAGRVSSGALLACLLLAPGPAAAWKVDTHVYAANLVLEEALSTLTLQEVLVTDAGVKARIIAELQRVFGRDYGKRGRVDYLDNGFISWVYYPPQDRLVRVRPVMAVQVPPFGWVRLSEDMARAILYFPGLVRAGAVGPDLFPDLITGQTIIHPGEGPISGRWAAYLESEVRRIAALYDGSAGSFDESPVLRAYYAGWLAHMAGDLFGHAWVNDYAGGVWPTISDGITSEEKNNILRHLIVESYVGKKIPPAFLTGPRVAMDLPAGAALTGDYVMRRLAGNGGRIDHDDSEDDSFGVNPIITGYATGAPYHLDMIFEIRDSLRRVTRNINWDALWAGFILQLTFGYFDFGQASLLYNHYWFHDVDTALDRLVGSQLAAARRMASGEGFGAWFDELDRWLTRYGLSALGLPDAVGRGIEMSSAAQEAIADAILPDEIEQAMSDLKRWFIDAILNEAFGFTLTELENYLRDPGTALTLRALFPEGTKARIDAEMGTFGTAYAPTECWRINFAPFLNTVNMIKLQLVDPDDLARVLWTEGAFPQVLSGSEEYVRLWVGQYFRSGVQMQFMRSLDAGYDWDRPDFAGCLFWDSPEARQKFFHRVFRIERPSFGQAPVLSVATRTFGVALPESRFRPRFAWSAVAGQGPGGAAPPPAGGTTIAAPGRAVAVNDLPELTFPDYGVVARPRPFGQTLAVPEGIHVHPAALAFAEAPPPPPVVLRFFADAKKYVVDNTMKDAASVAKLGEGGVLAPLDLVARELGAGLAYDAGQGTATLTTPEATYELRAGSAEVLVNGVRRPLGGPGQAGPVAAGATLLVPPGFFEEHLGARVVSLEKDKTVTIERRKFADDAPSTVSGAPAAAEAAKPAAGAASPWSGKWETTIGAMDIVVAADGGVDFNYDGEFGRLEGRVSGVRLTGRFTEDNGSRGEIVLTLGRENRTFTGQWRRTDIADDYWHGCEGWRPFEDEAGGAAAAAGAADAASSAWAGSWDSSIGELVLRAEGGGIVKGGYDGTFGRIEGRVAGAKLTGRFFEDNGNWGEFEFVLEPGGRAFKGRWRRLNVEGDDWHDCDGRRTGK